MSNEPVRRYDGFCFKHHHLVATDVVVSDCQAKMPNGTVCHSLVVGFDAEMILAIDYDRDIKARDETIRRLEAANLLLDDINPNTELQRENRELKAESARLRDAESEQGRGRRMMKRPEIGEIWDREVQDEDELLDWITRAQTYMDAIEAECEEHAAEVVALRKRLGGYQKISH